MHVWGRVLQQDAKMLRQEVCEGPRSRETGAEKDRQMGRPCTSERGV